MAVYLFVNQYKEEKAMIANIHQTATTSFQNVSEKQATKLSTYKERVIADRVVMLIMLLGTITLAIITA
ncbi:hypothetical protein MASR2M52_06270 [Pedobacter sp.]